MLTVDIIGEEAPEYGPSATDMSVYGGVQMGGGGAPSEANYSTLTSVSRSDPEQDLKRKAAVSVAILSCGLISLICYGLFI